MNDSISEKENILSSLDDALSHSKIKKSEYIKLDELNKHKSELHPPKFSPRLAIGIILAILIGIVTGQSTNPNPGYYITWIVMCLCVIPFIFPTVWYAISKSNYKTDFEQTEKSISTLTNNLMNHYASYTNSIQFPVGFEYSSPDILSELKSLIPSGRADNVKEAINCLEDDIHKWKMLETQKQIVKNTKEAANAATANALFSAGIYLNTRKK